MCRHYFRAVVPAWNPVPESQIEETVGNFVRLSPVIAAVMQIGHQSYKTVSLIGIGLSLDIGEIKGVVGVADIIRSP